MATNKKTALERLKELEVGERKPAAGKIEKIEKKQVKPVGKKYIKKGNKGGARKGSGRKRDDKPIDLTGADLKRTQIAFTRAHANEFVDVRIENKDTGKTEIVKMTRLHVILESLFKNAQKGETQAMHEYLDRVLGKAAQPIVGDEEQPVLLKLDV